jgi:hypothetical protein
MYSIIIKVSEFRMVITSLTLCLNSGVNSL